MGEPDYEFKLSDFSNPFWPACFFLTSFHPPVTDQERIDQFNFWLNTKPLWIPDKGEKICIEEALFSKFMYENGAPLYDREVIFGHISEKEWQLFVDECGGGKFDDPYVSKEEVFEETKRAVGEFIEEKSRATPLEVLGATEKVVDS